jgi:N-acetyl-1-D-myo-inositol-2-amino-2-deoxy-alpha-D-glucopyranoside deacetylase
MRTALVVHAHPDDEVFATGAATWVLNSTGWRVVLRVATPGMGTAAERLTGSCELLGIDEWDWLGESGQWIDDGGRNGPRTLASADQGEVAEVVERTVRAISPELVLTVGSDGLTGHPDHIAVSRAVQLAVQGHPCRTLGARLRAEDVRAGEELVRQLLPDEQVGSGQVVGCPDSRALEEISGAPELSRRRAMDQYYDGLGTKALPELVTTYGGRGDGLLLRAVFDAAGWQQDRFEVLA